MTAPRKKQALAGYLFASPWLFGFLVFMTYPLVASIYFSLCDYSVLQPPMYIGLQNYADLMKDEVFWQSLSNTFIYAAMALPLGLVAALFLAMLLNAKVKGQAFFRTIFFLPALVPQVSLAMLWLWLLNGQYGVLNEGLSYVGIHGPDWLGSPAWSKPSMVLLSIWGVGNAMLIYLASLQDVPTHLLEAADLDGATAWHKTWHVTLPMISPVILFNLIMGIIGSIQVFSVPYIMFPGGTPERSAYFYTMYLYDNAFIYHHMGYACAMGWIMFLMIFGLTMIALKSTERHVHYQGG